MSHVRKSQPGLGDVHVPVAGQGYTQPSPQKSRRRKPRAKLVHVLQAIAKAGKGYNPNRAKDGKFASGRTMEQRAEQHRKIRIRAKGDAYLRQWAKDRQQSSASVPDNWHEEGSQPHPWADGVRYVQDGDAVGMYEVKGRYEASRLDPSLPDGFSVSGIVGGSPKGGGAAVIRHLTRQADRHQVALYISPEPFGPKRLNKKQLRAWYQRHGWVDAPQKPGLYGTMVRLPR